MRNCIFLILTVVVTLSTGAVQQRQPINQWQQYPRDSSSNFRRSQGSKCHGLQFLPQCSSEEFLSSFLQCNKNLYRGYPYRYTGQCMSNVDQWLECMNMNLQECMSSECPSFVTNIKGVQKFMPIIRHFKNVNSLDLLYQAFDDTVADIVIQLGYQITPWMRMMLQNGVKNLMIPLPGLEGLNLHQVITESVCPRPGRTPKSFRILLPSIQSAWNTLEQMGLTDTSSSVPICDGDITSYLFNNILENFRRFYRSTTRDQFCNVVESMAGVVNNVLGRKCDFNQIAQLLIRQGLPQSTIAMFQNTPQLMMEVSGCQNNQMRPPMNSRNDNNKKWAPTNVFTGLFQNLLDGLNTKY